MNSILAVQPAIADSPETKLKPPIAGQIEFRNLNFSYHQNDEPVLRDINLTIPAGQIVAFVGRTGSGKSTLVNLIARVVEAPENTVLVDNVSVRDYPLAQLRSNIGYVPQETFLFSDTLAENIGFGVERVDRKQIEWAADVAGLTEDIAGFPDGYDTLVGERGLTLSGGQKQRTAIARAMGYSSRLTKPSRGVSVWQVVEKLGETVILRSRKATKNLVSP